MPKNIFLNIIFTIILCIAPILAIEVFLRVAFGYPHGTFNYLLSSKNGLYPRNSTILMDFGFTDYTVKTNSFGMRGPEVDLQKPKGTTRIVALGDSVTDGFFVDDEHTYPYLLEKELRADDRPVEALNAARGGGSIDKEYAILRSIMSLKPDIVLLTFVTNDISDISERSRDELLSMQLWTIDKRLPAWLFTKTAIGEAVSDLRLKFKYKNYQLAEKKQFGPAIDPNNIFHGDNYQNNVKIFYKIYMPNDGIITKEPFSSDTLKLIDNYLFALKGMNELCRNNGARLVFVYYPNYAQIYDPSASLKIRDILKDECNKLSVPFLDLTGTFQDAGKDKVLHFAPLDFHCNSKGNKVMAEKVAKFLEDDLKIW